MTVPRPRWPPWYGFAALLLALVVAVVAGGILYAIVRALGIGAQSDSPGVTIGATVIQDGALVLCAVWLAAHVAPPRAEQFGLRSAPLRRAIKWALIAAGLYLVAQLVYVALASPNEEQTTLQDLGAGTGWLATVTIGVLVVGVAPVAEEFFFRGFLFGALRTRFSWVPAALIGGIVFGVVHAQSGIEAVPPLVALGFAFCMCFEATGSILPTIALHALNNMIAFGADKDGSWAVGGVVAAAVLAGVVVVPTRAGRRPRVAST